ncbi:hypothetical protein HYD98_00935 [Mycoplasmopsis bovis]|nr:hypothetical protein [Mycoplasmopsis bovis]QQH29176.1 hypothetical protein HYD98_00935 [Mycoplasmopsis bovis]
MKLNNLITLNNLEITIIEIEQRSENIDKEETEINEETKNKMMFIY